MPAEDFSLAPTTLDGLVRRRLIMLYDPKPKVGTVFSETIDDITVPSEWGNAQEFGTLTDFDQIKTNFAGQLNTRVITIGGAPTTMGSGLGKNGFDYSADFRGWGRAFEDAGEFLREDPIHSQLIVYLSGSGGIGSLPVVENANLAASVKYEIPGAFTKLSRTLNLSSRFDEPRYLYGDLLLTPATGTSFQEPSDSNAVRLVLEPNEGSPLQVSARRILLHDYNGDGVADTPLGEALQILYSIPADDARALSAKGGSVSIENNTGMNTRFRASVGTFLPPCAPRRRARFPGSTAPAGTKTGAFLSPFGVIRATFSRLSAQLISRRGTLLKTSFSLPNQLRSRTTPPLASRQATIASVGSISRATLHSGAK